MGDRSGRVFGTGYKVVAIKAANEFRGQRAYN